MEKKEESMNKKVFSQRIDWTLAVISGFLAIFGLINNKTNILLFSIFVILVIILDVIVRKFRD
jgi:hypothetical protein